MACALHKNQDHGSARINSEIATTATLTSSYLHIKYHLHRLEGLKKSTGFYLLSNLSSLFEAGVFLFYSVSNTCADPGAIVNSCILC